MSHTVVSILRGGPAHMHEESLRTGHAVAQSLPSTEYLVRDIYIDTSGIWHERGLPVSPEKVLGSSDVVFISAHGDAQAQAHLSHIVEKYGTPYVGANSFNTHRSTHPVMSRVHAHTVGVTTPKFFSIDSPAEVETTVAQTIRTLRQPVHISSTGLNQLARVTQGGHAPVLREVQNRFMSGAQSVLIEEPPRGDEVLVGIVEKLRGEDFYILPLYHPAAGDQPIRPLRLQNATTELLHAYAVAIHQELEQRHYSESRFAVSPQGVQFLGIDTASRIPLDLTAGFTQALAERGIGLPEFLSHVLGLARSA